MTDWTKIKELLSMSNDPKYDKYKEQINQIEKFTPKETKVAAPTSEQKQQQFMATYKEPYSFGNKLKSDVGTFMTSIPKIPLAIWDATKNAISESGIYDTSKPFWNQGAGLTQQELLQKGLENAKKASLHLIPGFAPLETIAHLPYVADTKFGKAIPQTPVSSMANKFLLDSMIKNTGKWIYNPEAQTRKWFTPASDPTSRAQDYKERPFSSALEDITNVSILGAPIAKATGIGAKVAGAVNEAKPLTEIGNPLLDLAGVSKAKRAMIDIARPLKAIEDKIVTPLNQRSKLLDIVSEMKQKTFQRTEELKQGKLMQSLKGVSKENQPELQALIQKRASLLPDNIPTITNTVQRVKVEIPKVSEPIKAYHGTTQDFKTFREGDIGFHFGSTKTQALTRGKNIKEFSLDIKNPVIINKDLGNWNAGYKLPDELLDMGAITKEQYNIVKGIKSFGEGFSDPANGALRKILIENGYDGIKYINQFEKGASKPSYIAFSNKQLTPKLVEPTVAPIAETLSTTKPITYPSEYLAKQNSLTNALKTYEKSATIESTSLIKRGLLKEGVQTNAAWKDLTTEFGKSIDELKTLGINEPVYYPHTFEKYNVSSYAKLRSKKANYLKTKQGVTSVEGKGIEEPIMSIPKHKVEFIVQKTVGQALKEVETQFGKPIVNGEILPGYSAWNPKQFNLEFYPIEGRAIGSQGALKPLVTVKKFAPKLQIPKFLNDEIVRMVTPVTGIAKTVGAVWDKATNSWKISVLALSPRWVFNNVMGNTMLNTLAGVINPASYIEAGKRLIKGSKQAKTEGITFARAMSRQHIPEGAWEGLYRAEARSAAPGKGGSWLVNDSAPVTGMWKKLGYKLEAVPKAMYNFNSTIESFYRTAHYIDKIDAGLNPVKALASVNEFLFDYSKLSVMEKAIARRIVPFYAWQKNITRLLATYPFKHPVGMAVLGKLDKIAVEAQKSDESQDFMPEWFKSYMKTPIKNEQGQNLYALTRGINPFADIGALSGDALSYLSGINPMLKIPLERALGMSLYKGKAFTSPTADIMGGNETVNPPLWRHILSNFPQFTTAENIAKPYAKYDTGEPMLDKEGKLKSEKSRLLEALKLLGINLTPYDPNELKQTEVERLMREETIKKSYAEKMRKFQQSQ